MSRPTDWPRLHRKERQGSRSKAGGRVVQRLLKRTAAGAATLFVVASGGSLFAQAQDFSGTWKLDRAASRFTLPAFSGGRGGTAIDWLFITHAANGTLVIGSETNGIKAWSYMPGHEGTIPVGAGLHHDGHVTLGGWADHRRGEPERLGHARSPVTKPRWPNSYYRGYYYDAGRRARQRSGVREGAPRRAL